MNKKQFTITATIIAKPEKRELVKQALLDLIPPTLKEEGCLNYDLHQDNENLDRFFFYENWATRDLWLNHNASAHIAAHKRKTVGSVVEVVINELTALPLTS
jgi:quinol monooxygenase YgiN